MNREVQKCFGKEADMEKAADVCLRAGALR